LGAQRVERIDLGIQAPDEAAEHSHLAIADRALLREALTNLVANAIAYTPAEGTITVFAAGDAAGWSLNVEDDGPGLGEEERAQ
ncbi:ATP-binding protein, partial [Variovorax sp. CT11-76]